MGGMAALRITDTLHRVPAGCEGHQLQPQCSKEQLEKKMKAHAAPWYPTLRDGRLSDGAGGPVCRGVRLRRSGARQKRRDSPSAEYCVAKILSVAKLMLP